MDRTIRRLALLCPLVFFWFFVLLHVFFFSGSLCLRRVYSTELSCVVSTCVSLSLSVSWTLNALEKKLEQSEGERSCTKKNKCCALARLLFLVVLIPNIEVYIHPKVICTKSLLLLHLSSSFVSLKKLETVRKLVMPVSTLPLFQTFILHSPCEEKEKGGSQ